MNPPIVLDDIMLCRLSFFITISWAKSNNLYNNNPYYFPSYVPNPQACGGLTLMVTSTNLPPFSQTSNRDSLHCLTAYKASCVPPLNLSRVFALSVSSSPVPDPAHHIFNNCYMPIEKDNCCLNQHCIKVV